MNQQPAAHQPNGAPVTEAKDKPMHTDDPNRTPLETRADREAPRTRGGDSLPTSLPPSPTCMCDVDASLREIGDNPLTINEAQDLFVPNSGYLDTATYGLPSFPTAVAVSEGSWQWLHGRPTLATYNEAVAAARDSFGRIVRVPASRVAIHGTTADFVAAIANTVKRGTTVLISKDEFTSACWPFLAHQKQRHYKVEFVPFERLADAIRPGVSLIVVSAAQSIDGSVADLHTITSKANDCGAWTMVDATQAVGWMPLDANQYTFLICHAYKFIGAPRGAVFMAIQQDMIEKLLPHSANWCAGEDPSKSLYGPPLRLANDARRHDSSPAWLSWLGAVPALKLIEKIGVHTINRHGIGLANDFREGMGMPRGQSPIVSVRGIPQAKERLANHGLRASVRGDGVRLAFHIYNSKEDVEKALDTLRPRRA
ncbi:MULTISPECIES: aminotransferase class V-fold PLP-dependent enzyme [Streptomyces]|uniref:aminotransferase class V-fold PLP-dependent enzyme n=1 Tax=Streptomyces TaxID=1883 RepID=UPI003432906A